MRYIRISTLFPAFCAFTALVSPTSANAEDAIIRSGDLNPVLEQPLSMAFETAVPSGDGRVDPDLLALRAEFLQHRDAGRAVSNFRPRHAAIPARGEFVVVDAAAVGEADALAGALQAMGARNVAAYGRMVSALVPISTVDALSTIAELRFVRPAYMGTHAGAVTSQGDAASYADLARGTYAVDGAGVSVGVYSDSYDCLGGAAGDVAADDLPSDVLLSEEISDCSNGSDEGRAMMQLIHDSAPGSPLGFYSVFNNGQAGFATGIETFADLGIPVLVDDIIYYAEPMFQDGPVAQAVDYAVAQGSAYFSAAGNAGRDSYESAYRQASVSVSGSGLLHDFDPGASVDAFQQFVIPAGGQMLIALQWDDPFFSVSGAPGAETDLDLYLLDEGLGTVLGASASDNFGGDPVEIISGTNTGTEDLVVNLAIEARDGSVVPDVIKYVRFGNSIPEEWTTASSTIYGHANAEGAIAVGAAFWEDTPVYGTAPPQLEPYSAAGPTPILFDTAGNPVNVSRQKPEITCVDGGNTTFFGTDVSNDADSFPNFFGTSAAAPLAAAIAALMLDEEPSLTPAQIERVLMGTAIDMGVAGVDDDSGAGLCNGQDAVEAVESYGITVAETASPTSVDEPGGSPLGDVTYTVDVANFGNNDVELTTLVDAADGDLDGQGTCALPQTLAPGATYQCAYSSTVSGNAGDVVGSVLTGTGDTIVGPVSDTGEALVTVNDVLPAIAVTHAAGTPEVEAPGDTVTYTVRVDNASTEPLDLDALTDDVNGNLEGQGTCATLPQSIPAGGFYACSYDAAVSGQAGDSVTATVQADASDDEGNSTAESDSATVAVVAPDQADLVVRINDWQGQDPARSGDALNFTVNVSNQGTAEAADVSVTLAPAPGLAPVSTTGCDEDPSGVPTCTLGSVPVGDTRQVVLRTMVDSASPGILETTATASTSTSEADPADNADSESTEVLAGDVLFKNGYEVR